MEKGSRKTPEGSDPGLNIEAKEVARGMKGFLAAKNTRVKASRMWLRAECEQDKTRLVFLESSI